MIRVLIFVIVILNSNYQYYHISTINNVSTSKHKTQYNLYTFTTYSRTNLSFIFVMIALKPKAYYTLLPKLISFFITFQANDVYECNKSHLHIINYTFLSYARLPFALTPFSLLLNRKIYYPNAALTIKTILAILAYCVIRHLYNDTISPTKSIKNIEVRPTYCRSYYSLKQLIIYIIYRKKINHNIYMPFTNSLPIMPGYRTIYIYKIIIMVLINATCKDG